MVNGMYVSPERVVRGGYLIAFEGEVMGMDEAARRGLDTAQPDDAGIKSDDAGDKKLKADWIAEAEALGIEVPNRATVEEIKALIEAAGE